MPSKKSKPTRKARRPSRAARPAERSSLPSVWKEERGCSEEELARIATELACELRAGDRVLLEGPMGAGKTTFSRALLLALRVAQPPEGSPTFAIAHEYALNIDRAQTVASQRTAPCVATAVIHVDLYRIRSEEEIDERGIPDYFWDAEKIVISEWTSMWTEFEKSVLRAGRNWRMELSFSDQGAALRDLKIMRPS